MYKPNSTHSREGEGWGLPLMACTVRVRPKGVRYIKRLGIHEMTYLEWLENPSSKYLKGPGYIILIYLTLHENNKKISRLSDLFKSTSYVKGEPFSNGIYIKGSPFLSKIVYKRVRSCTLGRSLPVYSFRELKQRRRRRQRERQKSNRIRLAKQQLCTCITLFCTFLCRCFTTTTLKCLISRFVEGVYTRQRLAFFFSWTLILFFRIQLQKNLPTFNELSELE